MAAASILVTSSMADQSQKSATESMMEIMFDGARLRTDPYCEQFQRYESVKKSWVQAADSTHIFSADLDDSISRGTHTVTVRAIDEFGRVHHGHSILEITGGMRGTEAAVKY